MPCPSEMDNGTFDPPDRPLGGNNGLPQNAGIRDAKILGKLLRGAISRGADRQNSREESARAYYRLKQTARRNYVAKIEPVGEDPSQAEIAGQRSHHMVQTLAGEDYFSSRINQIFEPLNSVRFQPGL